MGAVFLILAGCAVLPSTPESREIQSFHPVGYARLIEIVPECAQADPTNQDACRLGAQMAESSTTQLSTHRFLSHWKRIALDSKSLDQTERIILPVLRYLYRFSRDGYSRAMLPELDRLILSSPDSLEGFEKVHEKHMAAYQK